MASHKYEIREICGDWALDIHWGNRIIALYFNSRNNAELVKSILEWEDAHPNEAVPYKTTITPPNEPRMINADQLAKRIAGHSNYHGDSILAAIYCAAEGRENAAPIRPVETPLNNWVHRVRELDELYTKIKVVTGFTAEQLLEMFAAGYTLEGPDYSKPHTELANLVGTAPSNEPLTLEFDVVDTKTGQYPDWEHIARTEDWADGLVYCDIDGIAIREDGSLILLDECGNCVSCPRDRFEIRRPLERKD